MKLVSHEGRLLDMNPAGLAMIGATNRAQVIGHSIITLVHPDDRSRFLDLHQSAYAACRPAANIESSVSPVANGGSSRIRFRSRCPLVFAQC